MDGDTIFLSRTTGVFPIACKTESRTWLGCVTVLLPRLSVTPVDIILGARFIVPAIRPQRSNSLSATGCPKSSVEQPQSPFLGKRTTHSPAASAAASYIPAQTTSGSPPQSPPSSPAKSPRSTDSSYTKTPFPQAPLPPTNPSPNNSPPPPPPPSTSPPPHSPPPPPA